MRPLRLPALGLIACLVLAPAAGLCDAAAPAAAEPVTSSPTRAEQIKAQALAFGRARFDDARTLLMGPARPDPAPVTSSDCAELYYRRVALAQRKLDYGDTFWDDPRNRGAVFVGAVWTPAFYFLAWSALDEYTTAAPRPQLGADLDALRAASARLRCFER